MDLVSLLSEFIKDNLPITMPRSPEAVADIINRNFSGKRLVIYGTGPHTAEVLNLLSEKVQVAALADDEGVCNFPTGLPVVRTDELKNMDFDHVFISNSLFMKKMAQKLKDCGIEENRILDIYSDVSNLETFIKYVPLNIKIKKNGKRNILVIVPFENADHITRFSSRLKEQFNLYKVYYSSESESDVTDNFRDHTSIRSSLFLLAQILVANRDAIDLVVINAIPSNYHLVYFIKNLVPELKVAASFIDVLSFYGEKEKIVSELEFGERYDMELKCEDFLIKNCEGLIASIDGKYAEETVFSRSPKSIRMFNYLPKDFFVFKDKGLSERPSLVYAGGVLNSGSDKIISADIKMYNVFRPLLESGLKGEAFFSNVDKNSVNNNCFDDFRELAKEYDFRFSSSRNINELIPMISGHDFGIMYYDFSETMKAGVLKKHLHAAIPTKIFTYLSAGLPILISEEIHSAKELILSLGVGIAVKQDDIHDIGKLIRAVDYNKLKSAVKRFQDSFDIDGEYMKLYNFINDIINKGNQ